AGADRGARHGAGPEGRGLSLGTDAEGTAGAEIVERGLGVRCGEDREQDRDDHPGPGGAATADDTVAARCRSAAGIVRPRVWAAVRLITSSNRSASSTGRSPA